MTEIVVAAVSGVFLLLAALTPHLIRQRKDVHAIKEQVQNSHGTNLRDDIDSLHRSVTWGFAAVHERLTNLQDQVDDERRARVRLADQLEKK